MSNYIIKHSDNTLEQINLRKFWKGIPISTLSDEEKLEHGWYPAEIVNPPFNPLIHSRNPIPSLHVDEQLNRGVITYHVSELSLQQAKQNYHKLLDETFINLLETGVEYKDTLWTATDRARDTLMELIEVAEKTELPVHVLDAQNNLFELNLSELQELRTEGLIFRQAAREWRLAKYAQVEASQTIQELSEISLNTEE